MTQQEQQLKLHELVKDEEYLKKLVSLGSAEAISEELENEDIELSPDEIRRIYALAKKKQDGELSDDELEQVAGGVLGIDDIIIGAVLTAFVSSLVGGLTCALKK